MTEKLGTLTAKIDALRAKGFSDDEINQLLSSTMPAEAPESPFNIGEIFNNGASKEEWNQQVDKTEQLYIKSNALIMLFISAPFYLSVLMGLDVISPVTWGNLSVISVCLSGFVMVLFVPKCREKIKFFIKKRR
ncbi:hypothetical protein [Photobacterium damselae]|uniref:hypothetical protein n=1 Tax=Photobacterium damselae TaxID=38293 RepID=UPI0030F37C00